jgi:hypothetical protein
LENENALLFKQGVFKVGGKLQNDFFKTLFYTAIAAFFRNFGLINIGSCVPFMEN